MRVRIMCSLLLLLSLFLTTVTPAQAEIIPVSPTQPPIITNQADAQKIYQLQNALQFIPFSEISPDDTTVLAAVLRYTELKPAFVLLNVQDGSAIPVKFANNFLVPIAGSGWFDANTLVYLSVVVQGRNSTPVLVTIDKRTGEAKTTPINLPAFPVSLAPDASRLIVAVEGDVATQNYNPLKSPFKGSIKRNFSTSSSSFAKLISGLSADEQAVLKQFDTKSGDMFLTAQAVNLLAIDLRSGQVTPMFSIPENASFASVAWSPDSSRFGLIRTVIEGTLGQGAGGTLISELLNQDTLGNLPPDKNPLYLNNAVDTYDFSTNTARPNFLTAPKDGNGDSFFQLSWSTDNRTLLTHMARPSRLAGRANPIYFVPESTYLRFYNNEGQVINTFDNEEINTVPFNTPYTIVFISPDEVLINTTRTTNNRIYYYNRSNNQFRQLPIPDGNSSPMLATRQSRQVVFAHSSFIQAPEMYRINSDGTNLTQLTKANTEITNFGKVRVDPVNFRLQNGQQRNGYLLQQASAEFPPRNTKMVVWQQGGPTGPFLNEWSAFVEQPYNLLPNFGFAVLFVPLPGRVGFGSAFLNRLADNTNFGQVDIDEMAEIVQQTVTQGWTSRGNIGITGCSYGGYFTSQSITSYPDLYTAANTQCTLLDMLNEWQFDQTPFWLYVEGKLPTVAPNEYVKDSPLYSSTKVRAATLIFHGTQDFLPIQIAANFHDQLLFNGVPVNLMAFIGAGHGVISFPQYEVIAAQAQINWFQKYLGSGG